MKATVDCILSDVMSLMLTKCKTVSGFSTMDFSKVETFSSREFPDISKGKLHFAENYFFYTFLRKYEGYGKKNSLRKDAAISQWIIDEQKNAVTNNKLRLFRTEPLSCGSSYVLDVILDAQRRISNCLGPLNVKLFSDLCKWGPGATLDIKRGDYRDTKMTKQMSTTSKALYIIKPIIEEDYHWMTAICGHSVEGPASLLKSFFDVQNFARLTTVPKNYKTDRTIDIQPTANGFLQQGVGRFIRRRLRTLGVNLEDQSVNQTLARRAYVDELATLDLSNASNTITTELVHLLLPTDWFIYLNDIRTCECVLPSGETYFQSKFSAMGNAFTFELETLIFHCLISSACSVLGLGLQDVSTYGDDLIVPQGASKDVIDVLEFCGFTINREKSFTSGPFFESCGKHFYEGEDVTPIYQKRVVNSLDEIVRLYNRIVRLSERLYAYPWFFRDALTYLQLQYVILMRTEGKRFKEYPKISMGSVDDEGFLSDDVEFDNNGGYLSLKIVPTRVSYLRLNQACYLALKFRAVRHSTSTVLFNSNPRGYVEEKTGDVIYKFKKTYRYS